MEHLKDAEKVREILPVLVPMIYSKVFGRDLPLAELKTHLYLRDLDEEQMKEALSRIPGTLFKNEPFPTHSDPYEGVTVEAPLDDRHTQGSYLHGRSPGMEKA